MSISDKEILIEKMEELVQQASKCACALGNPFKKLSKNNFLQGFNYWITTNNSTDHLFLENIDFSDDGNTHGKIGLRDKNELVVSYISFVEIWELT